MGPMGWSKGIVLSCQTNNSSNPSGCSLTAPKGKLFKVYNIFAPGNERTVCL